MKNTFSAGIRQYKAKLEQKQKETDAFFESCAKELAARLLSKVIKRTPVGARPELEGPRFAKVAGKSGKKSSFLTKEGARDRRYWLGYAGGTLRRAWTAKHEADALGGGGGLSPREYVKTLGVKRIGRDYLITVTNPMHYASYVEYGHTQKPGRFVPAIGKRLKKSWVEGQFMLTISEMELRNEAPALIERKLKAFLRSVMQDGK